MCYVIGTSSPFVLGFAQPRPSVGKGNNARAECCLQCRYSRARRGTDRPALLGTFLFAVRPAIGIRNPASAGNGPKWPHTTRPTALKRMRTDKKNRPSNGEGPHAEPTGPGSAQGLGRLGLLGSLGGCARPGWALARMPPPRRQKKKMAVLVGRRPCRFSSVSANSSSQA